MSDNDKSVFTPVVWPMKQRLLIAIIAFLVGLHIAGFPRICQVNDTMS
jgi:hypothetical protein